MTPAMQQVVMWLLILVSVALVAGITFIYSNRNRRVTFLLSLFSVLGIALIKLISVVQTELNANFIGKYDVENLPYMAIKPGWTLLIHAWHIWILPVVMISLIAGIIIFALWSYKKSGSSTIEMEAPLTPLKNIYNPPKTQRLDSFMAIEAAKKEAKDLNEKLSEALLTNAADEIKISDLTQDIKDLEIKSENIQKTLHDEIKTLKLELSAKIKENESIANQLSERNRDLTRAQEMFEKLAALHRKMQSGEN